MSFSNKLRHDDHYLHQATLSAQQAAFVNIEVKLRHDQNLRDFELSCSQCGVKFRKDVWR